MKGSDAFKKTILAFLQDKADKDFAFDAKFSNPKKNIDDCITYILNTVQKLQVNGMTDQEVYGMALHYYDEDEIDVGKPLSGRVVVNHQVELTEEEKEEIRAQAKKQFQEEEEEKLREEAIERIIEIEGDQLVKSPEIQEKAKERAVTAELHRMKTKTTVRKQDVAQQTSLF